MREVFEDLLGYEESYQISVQGRIFSKRRKCGNRIIYGKEIVPRITRDGYLKVHLSNNGKTKEYFLHRLIAAQFIPNPNNLPEINHKDGNKTNNNISNLEWCTRGENMWHAANNSLMQRGKSRYNAKLTEEQVLSIYKLKNVLSGAEISRSFGVSKNTINCILRGDKWSYLYKQYFKTKQ